MQYSLKTILCVYILLLPAMMLLLLQKLTRIMICSANNFNNCPPRISLKMDFNQSTALQTHTVPKHQTSAKIKQSTADLLQFKYVQFGCHLQSRIGPQVDFTVQQPLGIHGASAC